MDFRWQDDDSEGRFLAYVEVLSDCLGHADRVAPFRSYCPGLRLPGARKSVEPMAARLRPNRISAEHQSLLHFVGHQYCDQRGKQENCQVAVSLSMATSQASLPVAWRLYLPRAWCGDGAEDAVRRGKAKVPASIAFQSKPEIALEQLTAARDKRFEPGVVLADAGYGHSGPFRDGLTALGLDYIVGVQGNATVWPEGKSPDARRKPGRPPKGSERGGWEAPQVSALAKALPGGL